MIITDNINYLRDTAIAIGAFDALHNAHKVLIENTVKFAKENDTKSVVFTFDTNPSKATSLTTRKEKEKIFSSLGVDILFVCKFTEEFKNIDYKEFLNTYLKESKFVCVGFNFKFGKDRLGTTKEITEFCEQNNINYIIVDEIKEGADTISSTLIRKLISDADFSKAEKLLGRKVSVSGVVMKGDKIGRKLGFPTVNIENHIDIISEGVYATETIINGVKYKSVTNIGGKPTIRDGVNRIETHIIDFNKEIYGEEITIEFIKKIRDIIKFDNINDLIGQLEKDIAICK